MFNLHKNQYLSGNLILKQAEIAKKKRENYLEDDENPEEKKIDEIPVEIKEKS